MEPCYAMIPRGTDLTVFLRPIGDKWGLPEIAPQDGVSVPEPDQINRMVRAQYGLAATVLSAVRLPEAAVGGPVNIFTLERHDPAWKPPVGGRWFRRAELECLPMVLPTQERALRAWFAAAEGNPSPAPDIPWWRAGWLAEAVTWIEAEVIRLGRVLVSPVEQMRSAYTAAVLRVPTDDGNLYFKAIPSPLATEITVTEALADVAPACCPAVIAVDRARHWMLTRDIGGGTPDTQTALARWEEIVCTYTRIQVESASQTGRWLGLSAADWRLDRLASAAEALPDEVPARLAGLPNALAGDEIAALGARVPALKALCAELAACGIPPALEHGDLHAGNVRLTDAGPVFLDWSHACVTHPFFGLMDLLIDDDWFPEGPGAKTRLRDAYLEVWEDVAPRDRLVTAFGLALRLYRLYRAVHQGRLIAAYQEELGGHVPAAETPSGNALQYMQWWVAAGLRDVLHGREEQWR